jgi:branched-chain amino acid transport system substrate-binding protein
MNISKLAGALALSVALTGAVSAEISGDVVRIGILGDMSGIYSGNSGSGSVVAAQLAIDDVGGMVGGKPVELISADHQNKADVGSAIARRWIDTEGVDVIADIVGTPIALALIDFAEERDKALLMTHVLSADLSGKDCSANSVQWPVNTHAIAQVVGKGLLSKGHKSFYFITVDFAFGHQLQRDITATIEAGGGKVLGSVMHPLGTSDYSSFLLTASTSGADAIVLANAGGDTMNTIKQANEFSIQQGGQEIAGLVALNEMRALGRETAAGLVGPVAWYWNQDDASRAFARRFFEKNKTMPTDYHAGVYSAVKHYLRAVDKAGTDSGRDAIEAMKGLEVDDFFAPGGTVRRDGRLIKDLYLIQAKPADTTDDEWDVADVVATLPGVDVFQTLEKGNCPLAK